MTTVDLYDEWMLRALREAEKAQRGGDVPVGALIVDENGAPIGTGYNEREATHDPTAHAEIVALRRAAHSMGGWRLPGTTLIVTLEPCIMCAGAILAARVERIIFGAWDEKAGACGSVYDVVRDRRLNHGVEVIPEVQERKCSLLLTSFFRERDAREPVRPA